MDMDDEPRPSCNCKTSLCFQRYCNCFSNRWYCSDACRCESCCNTEAREAFVEERAEVIRMSKPGAFQSKGCSCRKSQCKKNYCECFKNRVACTERCKCQGCANRHGAKGGAILLHNNGDSSGTSDGGSTPDSSNGTSNETAVITDEGSLSPPESRVKENAPSDSDLYAFFKPFPDQDCFF